MRSRPATCWHAPPSRWLRDAGTPRMWPGCGPRWPTSRLPLTDAEAYARADLDLHMAIARAARNGPLAGALAALRRSIPGVVALRAHEAIADSSIDRVIDDYRQLVGAIELGDERRSLRALDRMFARSRALARELGLYPDDELDEAGPNPPAGGAR